MIEINTVEFYITNVCNYSCSNCNRLNNFKFSGHQIWNDYEEIYTQWSKRLTFKKISILGGEPTLNPTFRDWCIGIRNLWPTAEIFLVTNGSTFDKTFKDFYKFCLDHKITLIVRCHDRERYLPLYQKFCNSMNDQIFKTFTGNGEQWAEAYKQVKDETWPECDSIDQFENLPSVVKKECAEIHKIDPESYLFESNGVELRDSNGVKVLLGYAESFVTAPLKYSGNNTFNVYNSNPVEAHNVCISKHCHHFIKGKLYKCHHVALLPEFMEQYNVEINQIDKNLLDSYIPAEVNFADKELEIFVKNLRNVIDQCKLCPSNLEEFPVKGTDPKPNVKKIPVIAIMS